MNKKRLLATMFLIFSVCFLTISAQSVQKAQVNDILKDPNAYNQEEVEVSGLVIQYIEATEQTTSHYYLKDDFGAIIKIHTAESKPETNEKYTVRGILYIEASTLLPFISEKSKIKIAKEGDLPVTDISPALTSVDEPATEDMEFNWWKKNWLLLVIIGSAFLLLVLLIVLLGRKGKAEELYTPEPVNKPSQIAPEKLDFPVTRESLKTMVIPSTVPKTMKFIPGELEVITGEDKGRIIRIGGYPTEEGSIVTIGREQVTGPRDFAHIQLKERTISRRQAELILKDGKLYLKNLSETNFTKLDGKDLPPNTSAPLSPGSIMTFGEVEMKYKL
jgi:hypothetical protein